MNAIKRYFIDFAAWVKRGHTKPLVLEHIPVESWAERKATYERAQKAHRGQRAAYAHLREGTNSKLIEQIFADEAKCLRLIDTHPWLFRNPAAFEAAVKATARRRVREARR